MKRLRSWKEELGLTLPPLAWLLAFFAIPCLLVISISFREADLYGNIGGHWTFANYFALIDPYTWVLLGNTLYFSLLSSAICMAIALPVGYGIARSSPRYRRALLLWTILPFWTSFLIRVFAWKTLLHPEGLIKQLLLSLHLISIDTTLLYCPAAVIVGMVYTFLPLAILPVFSATERFDFKLMEAAQDLGMTRLRAFLLVFIPGIRKGLVNASLLVLIPMLGMYVIPEVLGGPESEVLGNKIVQRVFLDRNLPEASAYSVLLFWTSCLPVGILLFIGRTREEASNEI